MRFRYFNTHFVTFVQFNIQNFKIVYIIIATLHRKFVLKDKCYELCQRYENSVLLLHVTNIGYTINL